MNQREHIYYRSLVPRHRSEVRSDAVQRLFLRRATPSPIFFFRLDMLGIDAKAFLEKFVNRLNDLPWDLYDVLYKAESAAAKSDPIGFSRYLSQRQADEAPDQQLNLLQLIIGSFAEPLQPFRRRAATRYELRRKSRFLWSISELPQQSFTQSVGDERVRPRKFASITPDLIYDSNLLSLLAFFAEIIHYNLPHVYTVQSVVHLMATYAFAGQGSEPAPEGVHKDGSDYVMTALVLDRQNVVGGVSSVFAPEANNLVFKRQLEPGEGLFHADQPSVFWHSVSSIKVANESLITPSFRAILGMDFLLRGTSA